MTDEEIEAYISARNERTAVLQAPRRAEAYASMDEHFGPVEPGVPYDEMYRIIQFVTEQSLHWASGGIDCLGTDHTEESRRKDLDASLDLMFWFAQQHGMI